MSIEYVEAGVGLYFTIKYAQKIEKNLIILFIDLAFAEKLDVEKLHQSRRRSTNFTNRACCLYIY